MSFASRLAALALCLAIPACGGDDGKESSPAAGPETAAKTETAGEPEPTPAGATVSVTDLRSCFDATGLDYTVETDESPGVKGYVKVSLGEGQFEDPAADGSFGFFGHALVFEDAAGAEKADESNTGSRFMTGRVQGNVYTGFNTDLDKVPATKGGDSFLTCVQGG